MLRHVYTMFFVPQLFQSTIFDSAIRMGIMSILRTAKYESRWHLMMYFSY